MQTSMLESYHPLPSFDEAEPLGAGDAAFVAEIRAVLAKHGNSSRFGLCLIHEHFPVKDDEILFETNDPETRTLTLRVMKRSELADTEVKITSWNVAAWDPETGTSPFAMTACAQDKCKDKRHEPVAMTACAQDKCKDKRHEPVAMTACAEDKCKDKRHEPVAMTARAQDKCKAPMAQL